MTTPEEEEFQIADEILQNASIVHLPVDASEKVLKSLIKNLKSCVFYHGDILSTIEKIIIPLPSNMNSNSLFIQSYGISTLDMGSGRGVWEGSILFASWLCLCALQYDKLVHHHKYSFQNKRILELGAGCSGVPSLAIAKNVPEIASIVLTDIHDKLIKGLDQNIRLNYHDVDVDDDDNDDDVHNKNKIQKVKSSLISTQKLNWNDYKSPDFSIQWNDQNNRAQNKADIIIGAELLWAGCDPLPLIKTIQTLLDVNGVCYILMPKGGRGVEELFLETLLAEGFQYQTVVLKPTEVSLDSSSSSFQNLSIPLETKSSRSLKAHKVIGDDVDKDDGLADDAEAIPIPSSLPLPKDVTNELVIDELQAELFQVHIITFREAN